MSNNNLSYDAEGFLLTEHAEGVRLEAYPDPATRGAPWTIGYGHTGPDIHPGMTCTLEQAHQWLKEDIRWAETGVRTYATVDLTQGQFNALVDFAFNCGIGALRSSTLLRKLNSKDHLGASNEFARWDHAGGKVMPGLTARRMAEAKEFLE